MNFIFSTTIFDSNKARQIRSDSGLSLRELAKEIGVSSAYISQLENQDRIPRPKPLGTRKYLFWLKDKGYNPFNI